MKKTIKSWKKTTKTAILSSVLVVIAAIVGVITLNVNANDNVPKTLSVASDPVRIEALISTRTFTMTRLTSGEYIYCLEFPKLTHAGYTMVLNKQLSAGYDFFIENGFPKKSFTGNNQHDYYITQTALWWYIDDTTGTNHLGDAFKTATVDKHNLIPHIKKLVADAKAANDKGRVNSTLSVSVPSQTFSYSGTKSTYYSSAIKVTGTKLDGRYSVTVSGVSGAYVTDTNGSAKSAFLPGESFKVAVPYGKATELNNKITVTIKAIGKVVRAYSYKVEGRSDIQEAMPPHTTVTQNHVKEIDLTLSTSKLTVYKKDSESKDMLAGAKLALYDMNGVQLKSWTTTTTSLTIAGLVPGKYYIRELEAPNGYNMINTKIDVTLDAAEHKNLTIYNVKAKQTQVTIVKRDKETGGALPGAKLQLKSVETGEVISTWISTEKGRRFTGLPEGEYEIIELQAPSGYDLISKTYKVNLVAGEAKMVDVYNNKTPEPEKPTPEKPKPEKPKPEKPTPTVKITKLRVAKFDASNGELLANAKLQIKNASGVVVKEWTTSNTEYYVEGLPAGKYALVEVSAPSGYVLYTDAIEFELIANDMIQDVKMYNSPEVEVPITDISASKTTVIVGSTIMAAGAYVVYMNMKKRYV